MILVTCIAYWTLCSAPQVISTTTARRQSRARAPPLPRRCGSARQSPGSSAANWGAECAAAWEPTSTSSYRRRQGEEEEEGVRWPGWTAFTWSPPRSAFATTCRPPRCRPVPRRLAATASPTWPRGWRGEEEGGASPPPPPLLFIRKAPVDRWDL